VGFCQRISPNKLLVVTSHFGGEPQISEYHEFLNKPYIRMVKTRQFLDSPEHLVKNTYQFVEAVRKNKAKYSNQAQLADDIDLVKTTNNWFALSTYQQVFQRMRKFKFEKLLFQLESTSFLANYFDSIGVLQLSTHHLS